MSNRELAKTLIDQIPESRLSHVVALLQWAAVPDETPSADTLEAMAEPDSGGEEPCGKIVRTFYDAAKEL